MNNFNFNKLWALLRRKTSEVLIVSLIAMNLTHINTYASDQKFNFVQEIEVDESSLDDDMFYIPHKSLEVTENDAERKHVFRVKRKGSAEKAEKVKLTMVDISAKYDRDYSIRVIDKLFFKENVQNKNVSKTIDEYMRSNDFEEYNYSDSVIDGSINDENIMSEDEKNNYELSDEEKDELTNNAKNIFDEYGIENDIKKVDDLGEEPEEDIQTEEISLAEESATEEIETIKENVEETETSVVETIGGFTHSDEESKREEIKEEETTTEEQKSEEQTTEEATEKEKEEATEEQNEETTTEEQTTEEEKSTTEEEQTTAEAETTTEEQTTAEAESTTEEEQTTAEAETTTEEQTTTVGESAASSEKEVKEETTTVGASSTSPEESTVASYSEIIYGDETVEFETVVSTNSTLSMRDAYEMTTGKKSDKVRIKPDRNLNEFLPNKNSLDDLAYMNDSIATIQEELKSAYVILEFKAGQTEKLIEINIKNDNKYRGKRQVGFNLSSVDESKVSGNYYSLTVHIEDDEEEEPTYINFVETEFKPEDGYVTVTIERSGDLSSIATCMIDTEDITAVGGRDYSKVHAKLAFGLGINVRKVKIPIVSYFANNSITFKLKLQEPAGALIGDKGTATCTIKRTDKSFKFVEEKLSKELGQDFDKELGANEEIIATFDDKILGAGLTDDIDMNSTLTGEKYKLSEDLVWARDSELNDNSYHYFIDDGYGFKAYFENHSVDAETAWGRWYLDMPDGGHSTKDISGLQMEWSCNRDNADILINHWYQPKGSSSAWYYEMYDKNRRHFDHEIRNLYFAKQTYSPIAVYFKLTRYGGMWRKSPTLTIHSIKPIWRMYNISLLDSVVPELVDANGNKTTVNDYSRYTTVSIDGAKTDGTGVAYRGKTTTIKLDNTINNPFYIKALYIKNTSTGKSELVAKNDDTSATTISYKMDAEFAVKYDPYVELIEKQGGGWNGRYKLYVELGTKPSKIRVVKDDRVTVKIWNTSSSTETKEKDGTETVDWDYNIGDKIHFNVTMNPAYGDTFRCDGLNIYREKPWSPEWITIRKPTDGSDYFPLDAQYSEIKVVPQVSLNDNQVTVRIRKDMRDLFDTSYGFFAEKTPYDYGSYYDYYIAPNSTNITGKYFDIKARCLNSSYTPVWSEKYKENIRYMQNEYFYLGQERPENNIIYLTCEPADDIEYTVSGTAYYEETPIGGRVIDRYWQVAPYVGVVIDETHFAYSDSEGNFSTIPGKGKNGYFKKLKIISNGVEKYVSVKLNNRNKVTKQYKITYIDGEKVTNKEVYDVQAEEILISNINTIHPHVTGVKVKNMDEASFNAVYINDRITILEANVQPKKLDDTYYTYTYLEEDGTEVTANEEVKRVEFLVVDMKSHNVKTVIQATRSNADKTLWTASYTFKRGYYSEYMSGDKLYVRMVTNKKVGDGKGYDSDRNERVDVPIFNETTYQSITTTMPFIEEAEQEPALVNINFPTKGTYSLPLLGDMACMLNAIGLSLGVAMDGDRIRLFIGKRFVGKGNQFDEKGNYKSDSGQSVSLTGIKSAVEGMKNQINSMGKKRAGMMTLGVPSWQFQPIVGIYFEFALYHDSTAEIKDQYLFTGGGGYLGAILNGTFNFYFLVYGIPCYVGGSVDISFVGEFGVATDEGTNIALNDPSQSLIEELTNHGHFEFLFRAILYGTAYVGVGIAGCVGVRGGFMLRMMFIDNPYVSKKYTDVREMGFAINGYIRIWIDAVLLSIPIPVYNFPDWVKLGYFKDVEKYYDEHGNLPLFGSSGSANKKEKLEWKPKPRPDAKSKFVANDDQSSDDQINDNLQEASSLDKILGSTYVEDETKTKILVENAYDNAEAKLMKFRYNGRDKVLLVYIDDDKTRGDLDRTVLMYSIYDIADDIWTEPRKVWEDGPETADFSPTLCHCGTKILLAWAKRPEPVDETTPKEDLLKKMEIYTSSFNLYGSTLGFGTPERMTDDDKYDNYPQITYSTVELFNPQIHLYYLKNDNVTTIATPSDLLDNVQPEVSGAYLMYMFYGKDPRDDEFKWLKDYYYATELPEDPPLNYIELMKGQRVKDLSINVGTVNINDPSISDYACGTLTLIDERDPEELQNLGNNLIVAKENHQIAAVNSILNQIESKRKRYDIVAYVVDGDRDVTTKNDTELYLKLSNAEKRPSLYIDDSNRDQYIKTIRLSHNNAPDMMPKIIKNDSGTYLFWIQNESAIKMLQLDNIIAKAYDEDHANNQIEVGEINIMTVDKTILSDKINNITPFTDAKDNIYIAWQQDSTDNIEDVNDAIELQFRQDLYVAGLIKSEDNFGDKVQSWSNPVRFTNNGKINDLPSVVADEGKLLFVNNQYNLVSEGDGYDEYDSYEITNCNLQFTLYKEKSSLSINEVMYDLVESYDDGRRKYRIYVFLNNDGLTAAKGYDYNGKITLGDTVLTNINGSSDDYVIPGNVSRIGGDSIVASISNATPPIYITLTKEQQKNLGKAKVTLTVNERGVAEGVESSKEVFDVNEHFDFVIDKTETEKTSYGDLKVERVDDTFYIKGILNNSGNIDSLGNERIVVIDQKDWDHPIATSSYIDLGINEQMQFSIPLDMSVLDDAEVGVKDLVLYVKNDDGEILSLYEIASVNIKVPYNFKVNGETEKIYVDVGDELELNTTYMPSEKYKNATIMYAVGDNTVASVENNKLHGVATGSTTLSLTTKEYGGSKTILIQVGPDEVPIPNPDPDPNPNPDPDPNPNPGPTPSPSPSPSPTPYHPSSGGGGGGGGGLPNAAGNKPTPSQKSEKNKEIKGVVLADKLVWNYDPTNNIWKITENNEFGVTTELKDGFYLVYTKISEENKTNPLDNFVNDTYYFDKDGKMVTGWLQTADGKWYFLETEKNVNEGKMCFGWKYIDYEWYYFTADGSLLVSAITPDGYPVGADGKIIR